MISFVRRSHFVNCIIQKREGTKEREKKNVKDQHLERILSRNTKTLWQTNS